MTEQLHPLVQRELDNVSGADCPFCAVMGRINWKIMHQVAINQAAACEHCKDAPEMVSFLHDLVTIYKKKGKPFDKNNFEKWSSIASELLTDNQKMDHGKILDTIFLIQDQLKSISLDLHRKGEGSIYDEPGIKKLLGRFLNSLFALKAPKNEIATHGTVITPGEHHTHKSDFRERQADPSKCAEGSFRTRSMGDNHEVILCCPDGHWNGKKCSKTQILQSIIHKHGKSKQDPMHEYIERDLGKMITAILETDQHDMEHGFCGNSGIIKGKETDLMLPYCPEKLHFHTHNSGIAHPSHTDFRSSSAQNAIAECIGTHDGIACFHPHTQEKIYKS